MMTDRETGYVDAPRCAWCHREPVAQDGEMCDDCRESESLDALLNDVIEDEGETHD